MIKTFWPLAAQALFAGAFLIYTGSQKWLVQTSELGKVIPVRVAMNTMAQLFRKKHLATVQNSRIARWSWRIFGSLEMCLGALLLSGRWTHYAALATVTFGFAGLVSVTAWDADAAYLQLKPRHSKSETLLSLMRLRKPPLSLQLRRAE